MARSAGRQEDRGGRYKFPCLSRAHDAKSRQAVKQHLTPRAACILTFLFGLLFCFVVSFLSFLFFAPSAGHTGMGFRVWYFPWADSFLLVWAPARTLALQGLRRALAILPAIAFCLVAGEVMRNERSVVFILASDVDSEVEE